MSGIAPHQRRVRRGMSVAELLISLAITALLLTAAAVAYTTSARAVEINDQFFRASQSARVALNQILTEIRRCQAAAVDEAAVVLELTTNAGESRTYAYVPDNRTLTMTIANGGVNTVYTLARNVETMSFLTDDATITMLIRIAVGNNSITLNGSALPRRSVTYQ